MPDQMPEAATSQRQGMAATDNATIATRARRMLLIIVLREKLLPSGSRGIAWVLTWFRFRWIFAFQKSLTVVKVFRQSTEATARFSGEPGTLARCVTKRNLPSGIEGKPVQQAGVSDALR
jgi:hypothetical protein